MKYLSYLLLVLLLITATASQAATTYRYSNEVTTVRGDVVGGATVTVYTANTTTKATLYLYSSSAGTEKTNPTYTDGYGRYFFYALPGTYDITISGSNITTYTIEDVRVAGDAIWSEYIDDTGIFQLGATVEPDSVDQIGQFWFDSADSSLEFHDGADWKNLLVTPNAWDGHTELSDMAWDDIVIPASNIGVNAAADPPIIRMWKGVIQVWSFADSGSGDYAYLSVQMPHGWVSGTDVKPHFHFTTPDTILPDATVVVRFLYAPTKINATAGDTTTIYATCTNDSTTRAALPAGAKHFARILPNTHLIAGGLTIPAASLGFSSVIYGRIARGPGDTYGGEIYLLSADFHYQRNRLGSENEYTD